MVVKMIVSSSRICCLAFCRSLHAWDPKTAAIVGANVGAETDEHKYKSLMVTEELTKSNKPPSADKSKKPPPIVRPCKDTSEVLEKVVDNSKEINAMLNHHSRGTVHFGIRDKDNTVEEGLDLPQEDVIKQLQTSVGQLLQGFYPAVQSHFVIVSAPPGQHWEADWTVAF